MFHSVSLLSQAPLARRYRALPSVLFTYTFVYECEDSRKGQKFKPFNFVGHRCGHVLGKIDFKRLDGSTNEVIDFKYDSVLEVFV